MGLIAGKLARENDISVITHVRDVVNDVLKASIHTREKLPLIAALTVTPDPLIRIAYI